MATSSASCFGLLRTCRGARVMLSNTVRCGKRLNCWNTMPVSRRISWMLRMSSESSTPSTTIRPASCFSKRLMQRMSVDLPEPEGPITTTTSCLPTFRLMSLRAWKSPKNLSTPCTSIMASPLAWVASANTLFWVISLLLPASSRGAGFLVTSCRHPPSRSQPQTAR